MKPGLTNWLVCPLDKSPLELRAWETGHSQPAVNGTTSEGEIQSGVLVNRARKLVYPIYRGVPRMLTFKTAIADAFEREHGDRLRSEFAGYALPNEPSMPGEDNVLRNFSEEWTSYDWDGETYWGVTAENWFRVMRFVLELDQHPMRNKLVLEVGTGVGGVADYVARSEDCDLIGMDLGYGIDVAQRHFSNNPRLHLVQASIFAPPFASNTFDLAYSFGVIHHTFSTKEAFDHISKLPKPGGRLYIWVYSQYDESRTPLRRVLMGMENAIRPIASRLPTWGQTAVLAPLVPLYMAHQGWQAMRLGKNHIRYGIREALHAARDRFTPPYVHRHSEEEVAGWFTGAGYHQLSFGGKRERPEYVPVNVLACTGVGGQRQ